MKVEPSLLVHEEESFATSKIAAGVAKVEAGLVTITPELPGKTLLKFFIFYRQPLR